MITQAAKGTTITASPDDRCLRFLGEAWMKQETETLVRVGVFVPPDGSADIETLHSPRPGDQLERGLPLLTLCNAAGQKKRIASPVSGEVQECNPLFSPGPGRDPTNPLQDTWIARVRCRNLRADLSRATCRHVVMASPNPARGLGFVRLLEALGCAVTPVCYPEEAESSLSENAVLFLDAAGTGAEGAQVLEYIRNTHPGVCPIVLGPADNPHMERIHRSAGVAYYAIEPITVEEAMNMLASVFKKEESIQMVDRNWTSVLPKWMSRIRITTREGHVVGLRASGQILDRSRGLGYRIVRKLMDEGFPIAVTHGTSSPDAATLLREFSGTDRVWFLEFEDSGRAPGTLTRTTRPVSGVGGSKPGFLVPALVIQPVLTGPDPLDMDPATIEGLADHIVAALTTA